MGKYTFTWEHYAHDVYVTGTFDDWRKTVKLEKVDGIFKKTVELPKTHTQYKFVVNGNWCTNESARKEDDGHGIINNVLLPEDIVDEPVSTQSSAAPMATTAGLAGAVPKESEKTRHDDSSVPGAFPMTPAAETPMTEAQSFNINPLPATESLGNPFKLAPGEPVPDSSTYTDNTVHSKVKHDENPEEEASAFGVAPLPATAGAGNPIHLAPGEKVPDPSSFTSNTVHNTINTDSSSYEKSDALPPLAFTPQSERDAKGGMFGLPPVLGNMIPESSLPMGVDAKAEQDTGYTIQSAAPTSTTATLAGQVPKEHREHHEVPETVTESQREAGFAPEASANSEAVHEKSEMEQELKEKVPEAPAAADNSYASTISSNAGAAASTAAAGVTAGAGLFAGAIYAAKDKAAEAVGLDESATTDDVRAVVAGNIYSAKDKAAEAVGLNGSPTADDVPAVVSESQREAHVGPEAASNAEAVREKSAFEQELLSEVPKTTETGLPAPAISIPAVVSESQKEAHASPEAAANSEAVAEKTALESELLSKLPKTDETGEPAPVLTAATTETAPGAQTQTLARDVPDVVAESQQEAHASPEAAANAEAVSEKKAMESELLREIPTTNETGEPAPMIIAAATETAPGTGIEHQTLARDVPDVVAESQREAHASPEAAANTEAVTEKKAVESELLNEVRTTDATGEPAPFAAAATSTNAAALSDEAPVDSKPLKSSSEQDVGLNAPASEPAKTVAQQVIDSNTNVAFVKPEPTTTQQTQPTVTTGVETTTTQATSSAPTASAPTTSAPESPMRDLRKDSDVSPKGTPGTQSIASAADDKKKKRRSIFGKLKDKFSKN